VKSYILSGSTGTLTVNGTSTSTTVIDSAAGDYCLSNGPSGSLRFGGQIAEVMIFNRAINQNDITSITSYLNDKWGIVDTPPPVTAGLQLRLAANTINTSDSTQVVSQNGNTYVSTWRDSSGNGYNATQTTTSRQPLYLTDALYGQPAIEFNGSSDYMTTTLPQIAGNKSIFVVERRVDSQLRTEIASSAATSGLFLANYPGLNVETEGRLNVAQDLQTQGYLNGFILKSYILNSGTGTLSVNDTSVSAPVTDAASGTYTISGSKYFFAGPIAEVLIYNRALSSTEQQLTEDYLSQKYGLWENWLSDRAGLNLWLDANVVESSTNYQLPQVTGSGGNLYVNTWNDRSIYGFNATQATMANQPIYWPTNAPSYNGTVGGPVMRFDGAAPKYMTTSLLQVSGDKSLFVVHRRRNTALGREISTTATIGHVLENNGTSEAKGPIGGAPSLQVPGDYYQYIVKDFIRSGTTESLFVDDAPATTTNTDVHSGHYTISDPAAPFLGDIGTVLVYNRAVSTAERYTIEDYLLDRWSYAPNNIYHVAPDLTLPSDTATTTPAPGVMVQQTAPAFAGQAVYNTLYLPTNWQPGQLYPVIVEYPPNGGYTDSGYTTTGLPEDCAMGYGITGGSNYIVIAMPCIGGSPLAMQTQWWGSIAQTEAYCINEIQNVCQNYGGDPSAIIMAGFSRGACACNLIGLYDSNIADTWLAFIPHSGYDYDGEYGAAYPNLPSAASRLALLNGRAQYISQGSTLEGDWEISEKYYLQLMKMNLTAFTFRTLPFENHTGDWALRPIQLRRDVRGWLQNILLTRPGTHSISGIVTDPSGNPINGALVQSGSTHFTYTASNGAYLMQSLVNSTRTVTVTTPAYTFSPKTVVVSGSNVINVNFQAGH
jgi:hypothetical protein